MDQSSGGAAGLPLTVACNVTWPLAGIVTADGETVTVTLLGSTLHATTTGDNNQQNQ
jgi:hypothetical protein